MASTLMTCIDRSSQTRGLTEAACLTLVAEMKSRSTLAYCYRDGEPDPGWPTPPIDLRPICDECRPLPGRRRV